MAELKTNITAFCQRTIDEMVRQSLISNIGSLWDDYCYDNSVPSEIKLHGINLLEDFANKINDADGR